MSRNAFSRIAVVFLFLALAGCTDPYGVTPSDPLGTFEVMNHILADDKELTRSERVFTVGECFRSELHEQFGELKVFQYEQIARASLVKHVVLIAVDDVRIVRAVAGSFHSGRKAFSDSGGAVESYLASLWAQVNGGPAEFKMQNGPGVEVNEYLIATIEQGKVHGIWKKMPATGDLSNHQTIQDQVLLWID